MSERHALALAGAAACFAAGLIVHHYDPESKWVNRLVLAFLVFAVASQV